MKSGSKSLKLLILLAFFVASQLIVLQHEYQHQSDFITNDCVVCGFGSTLDHLIVEKLRLTGFDFDYGYIDVAIFSCTAFFFRHSYLARAPPFTSFS